MCRNIDGYRFFDVNFKSDNFFFNLIKNQPKQLSKLVICNKLLVHFFPSDRKVTNQVLLRKTMKRPSTALKFLKPKKLKYAILLNEDGKVTNSGYLKCNCRFIKIKLIIKLRKYCQNCTLCGVECIKVLDDNFCRTADLNMTIYGDTKFSSCHIQYTNNILHPVLIVSKVTRSSFRQVISISV